MIAIDLAGDAVHDLLVVAEAVEALHGGGADIGVRILRELDEELTLAGELVGCVEPQILSYRLANRRIAVLRELLHEVQRALFGELAGGDDDLVEGILIDAGDVRDAVQRLEMLRLHPVVYEVRPRLERGTANVDGPSTHQVVENGSISMNCAPSE